jgi:hypothetical protein
MKNETVGNPSDQKSETKPLYALSLAKFQSNYHMRDPSFRGGKKSANFHAASTRFILCAVKGKRLSRSLVTN